MTDWNIIRFTEARQVASLTGVDEDSLPAAEIGVRDHYATLRAQGRLPDAAMFIGHALPRLEAIAWSGHILDSESRTQPLKQRDRLALDYALRWLGDANDANRRSAYDAAENARERAPERLLGNAVFFSGGSISMPDLQPVLPPPEAANRFAAGAVLLAAFRSATPDVLLTRALDLAEQVAVQGMKALATP